MTGGIGEPVNDSLLPVSDLVIQSIIDLGWCLCCVGAAFLLTWLCYCLFNRIPAKWLCDYGEKPAAELFETRLFFNPGGIAASLLMALAFILCYYEFGLQSGLFYLCCLIALTLMLITLADYRYSIIPDQFTLVLALLCSAAAVYDLTAAQRLFHDTWWSPLAGAAMGGGAILVMNLLGLLLYKKAGVGFGDVKLFAAVGILAGWPNIFFVFLITILLAFFHFIALLITRKTTKDVYLPMGPYICVALTVYMVYLKEIHSALDWYMGLLA